MQQTLKNTIWIILPCIGFIVLDLLVYNQIGALAKARHVNFDANITLKWDQHIPYIKWFVLPYLLAWIYPLIALAQLMVKKGPDVRFFMRIYILVFIIYACHYVFWILVPVHFDFGVSREVLLQGNWLDQLTLWTYGDSSFFNSFPSFHIVMTVFIYLIVKKVTKDKWHLNLIIVILICASTLFIRIHYILDVLSGLIIATLFYMWWSKGQ